MEKKLAIIVLAILTLMWILLAFNYLTMKKDENKLKFSQEKTMCDLTLTHTLEKLDKNQEIINHLFEMDTRGEIKLDSHTIFMLGKIN